MIRNLFFAVFILLFSVGGVFSADNLNLVDKPFGTSQPLLLTGSDEDLMLKMQEDQQKKLLDDTLSSENALVNAQGLELTTNQNQKKTMVLLSAEPRDGMVSLEWKILNPPVLKGDSQLRFLIRYGIESEKLTKSVQLGAVKRHIVRELKNHQPYYFQIVAMDREQHVLYKSEEIRSTPLPIDMQGSRIEKNFQNKAVTMQDTVEPVKFGRQLKQFGYDFFRNSLQLSQAVDSLPTTDYYLVGPGDSMKLFLSGAINNQAELTVDRNGEVLIPKVGSVKVWGMTFEQTKAAIHLAISRYFKNFEMNLSLGRLRTIQVYVVGDVESPGSYPISSMSTVINALAAAGGPSKNGSLRSIRVSRGNQTLDTVDLYDMMLSGDRSKDLRLQNGDTIFVPVIGEVVAVAGEVRRPAIYELKGKTTLQQILQMAGGVTAGGDTSRIQIERLSGNASRIITDIISTPETLSANLSSMNLQDQDMVKIFPVPTATRQIISIKGNVLRPGEYQYKPGMRIKDVIPSTAVLLPETYLESVEITRISPPDYRKELLTVNLRGALAGNPTDNILLQEQDSIKVFSRFEMIEKPRVAVNGAVVNPGIYDYYPGMSVRDLLTAGGSAKRNAYLKEAELSRIMIVGDKAESKRVPIDLEKAISGDPINNILLQPDDVLIVRAVADWIDAGDKFVTLKGEVRFPGVYTVARGEKLSSVIERAGGYTDKSYLYGAKFTRKSVREQQQKRMDEIIIRTEKEITQKQAVLTSTAASKEELEATKATLEGMMQSLQKMKKLKAEGRVVIHLAAIEGLKNSSYNIEMEGGDVLYIPQRPGVVHVMGQVYNQTSFVYLPESASVVDYLNKAGGVTNDGDESEMYVIRADGSVVSRQQSTFGIQWSDDSKSWSFGGFLSKQLMPGDTIVVPQKIERTAWMRDIKDITQILANVAITAGTILVGLK